MLRCATLAIVCTLAAALPAAAQVSGKAVFEGKGNCHVCHGRNAEGGPLAPSLTDTVWINIDGKRESIVKLIEQGVPKPVKHPTPMPPMGGASLSREEIEAVADYVLSLVKKPAG